MRNKPLRSFASPIKQSESTSDSVRRGSNIRPVEIIKEKKKTYDPGKNAPKPGKIYSPQQEMLKAKMKANPISRLFL